MLLCYIQQKVEMMDLRKYYKSQRLMEGISTKWNQTDLGEIYLSCFEKTMIKISVGKGFNIFVL